MASIGATSSCSTTGGGGGSSPSDEVPQCLGKLVLEADSVFKAYPNTTWRIVNSTVASQEFRVITGSTVENIL
jgi:hypothetical protein